MIIGKVKVKVRCPRCGRERCVWLPVKRVKCFYCNHTFKVFYKNKKSTIVAASDIKKVWEYYYLYKANKI